MPRQQLKHFLVVYDHRRGRLIEPPEQFDDPVEATDAYSRTEAQYDQDDMVEVVLIGSNSINTVYRTHANYFGGGLQLLESIKNEVG